MTQTTLAAPAARELPQLGGKLFLTDGGLETTLLFHGCYCNRSRTYELGAEGPLGSLPGGEARRSGRPSKNCAGWRGRQGRIVSAVPPLDRAAANFSDPIRPPLSALN